MKSSGIYRINLGNGWFYIGSSVNMGRRRGQHLCQLVAQKHGNQKMQRVYDKYQIFEFEILFECPVDELLSKEQVLIDAHFTDGKCANLSPTAASPRGTKHSPQSCANMSSSARRRWWCNKQSFK